ncbi:MAG: TatD family hydrolase, partial [archaeon]
VHSHLCLKFFDKDREIVLQQAKKQGVVAIIDSGETLKENDCSLSLAEKFPILLPCAGFSPKNLKPADAKLVQDHIRANSETFIAIGEVGLDYWHVKEIGEREKQKKIFISFIELAKELNKPIVVHSRSAGKYAIDLLIQNRAKKVCMHAFDGSAQSAKAGINAGYFFSIPPSVKFSQQKQNFVRKIPIENLLLESDSPSLGPVRGERNEPKNIVVSLGEIAKLKNLSKEEVARITTENARKLFNLPDLCAPEKG